MFLRSGKVKKVLFPSTPFLTPSGEISAPRSVPLSVREQKDEAEKRQKIKKMAESVNALAQCCQTTRAKVERIKSAILLAGQDPDKFTHHGLKLYLKTVDSAYEEYNNFQNRIYLTDPLKREEFEPKFIEFEELYEFVRISLCEMIQHFQDMEKAAADEAALEREKQLIAMKFTSSAVAVGGRAGTSGVQESVVPSRMTPSLLLQQTPLPTFDGRYEHWHRFKARFCDIVDRCTQDSPATKLHYLDKALVGEAKGAIDDQTLNDNNYEGAWRILIERYENLPMVIHGHITKLLNLKPMAKESSLELRTLIDDCTKRVESLEFHKLKMDSMSEAIVITLLTSKLDPSTRRSWEASCEYGKLPVFKDTISFLRKHCHVLERCEQNVTTTKNKVATFKTQAPTVTSKAHTETVSKANEGCPVCGTAHSIDVCGTFKKLVVDERYTKAKQLGLCFGCLQRGHRTTTCKNVKPCPTCSKKHHVLMHPEEKKPVAPEPVQSPASVEDTSSSQPLTAAKCGIPVMPTQTKQILLATAVVIVYDCYGEAHKCRVLLDSGAMANFMTTSMAELLRLRKESANVPIDGVNGMKTVVKYKVNAKVVSRTTDFVSSLDYLVVPRVTGALPAMKINPESWRIPDSIQLADPNFHEPGRIDMLVGAELFFEVLQKGKIRLSSNLPLLQESQLGWLVSGPVADTPVVGTVKVCQTEAFETTDDQLCELLKRFWTIDQLEGDVSLSPDDRCESNFLETHSRTKDGRYVVQLPFRDNVGELGDSREQAMRRFMALERRLERQPELKQMYADFVNEYLALGHCQVVSAEYEKPKSAYYLPHHCVLKPDSSTTKLRVVFDASAKSSTDLSLNDVMEIGPTVQDSLFNILLRFRLHKYVFTADIPKMYRQVLVDKHHRAYQRILWRNSKEEPIRELELNTVTYGTAAAPFLATRSIIQLARDEREDFPAASDVVERCFYVDDVMTGADTLEEAKQLQTDLIALLERGGFQLHKWCANDEALLEDIPIEAQETQLEFEDSDINGVIKTLGILWNPSGDEFLFHVKPISDYPETPTKKMVLSEMSKLFDPHGLLAPTILIAKLVMQQLWQQNVGWNDPIPHEQLRTWHRFRSELPYLNSLRIDRRITVDDTVAVEIHGFADASKVAYGCCIYIRSVTSDGKAEVRLICGKSRVAPIKEMQRDIKVDATPDEMTIPRLELCAALLLAEQVNKVRDTLALKTGKVVLWSDSKIVLNWLKKMKTNTPVFVQNRVVKIRKLSNIDMWHYISTQHNPADLVSRGVFPADLMRCEEWWYGPSVLPTVADQEDELELVEPEMNVQEFLHQTVATVVPPKSTDVIVPKKQLDPYDVILKHSSYRKLQRIFGYVTRFIYNCRSKRNAAERRSGELSSEDYNDAQRAMVTIVQQVVYKEEIGCIQTKQLVKGKLRNLNPIYDEEERLLRVGGRIRNSDLPKDQKHPMILPEKNHFTEVLIETLHREHLHVGLNGLLAIVRQKFWPVNAKRTIHRILKRCVLCFRTNPRDVQQYMGDLPSCRVTAAQQFARTGIDYAGPFFIKVGRMRAKIKVYVCLFVCMATKCIHLELVSSLSTDGFLAALLRFTGRRGNPSELFSDNGTNFRGANRELSEMFDLLRSQMLHDKMNEFCQPRGIKWSFNPPKAPHQGGIWEANVKAMKSHLCKTLNESYLTYEELYTLLVQIESILNSRPLVQLTDDPFDYEALSPGHFFVGRELTAVAEPLYGDLKDTNLSRYQLVQKRMQHFWQRWSNEYVTTLQKRSKWYKDPTKLRNGLLVIVKEDNMPPKTWKLGRIIETHPGKDGVIRVVTIRTSKSIYKRPTTQIAVLPIEDDSNTDQP